MIQAARRFETRIAVVCLIGLHLLPLSSTLGLALCLGGAALWVELSHPKKVEFVVMDSCGRDGEDLAVLAGSRRREEFASSTATPR
jgi:hypothetical protein